jgi:hypothetical protein
MTSEPWVSARPDVASAAAMQTASVQLRRILMIGP